MLNTQDASQRIINKKILHAILHNDIYNKGKTILSKLVGIKWCGNHKQGYLHAKVRVSQNEIISRLIKLVSCIGVGRNLR